MEDKVEKIFWILQFSGTYETFLFNSEQEARDFHSLIGYQAMLGQVHQKDVVRVVSHNLNAIYEASQIDALMRTNTKEN